MPQRSMFGAVERPDRWENIRRLFSEVSERNLRNQLAEIEILGQQQEQERRTAMLERWRAGVSGVHTKEDVQRLAAEIPSLFTDPTEQGHRLRELQAITPDVPVEEEAERRAALTGAEERARLEARADFDVPDDVKTFEHYVSQKMLRGEWTQNEAIQFMQAMRGRTAQDVMIRQITEDGQNFDIGIDKSTGQELWRVATTERDPSTLYMPEYDDDGRPTGERMFFGDPQTAEMERSRLYTEIAESVRRYGQTRTRQRTEDEVQAEIERREAETGKRLSRAERRQVREEEIEVMRFSPEALREIEALERNLRAVYEALGLPTDPVIENLINSEEKTADEVDELHTAIRERMRQRAVGESPQVPRRSEEQRYEDARREFSPRFSWEDD